VATVSRDDEPERSEGELGAGDGRRVSKYQASGGVHLSISAGQRSSLNGSI